MNRLIFISIFCFFANALHAQDVSDFVLLRNKAELDISRVEKQYKELLRQRMQRIKKQLKEERRHLEKTAQKLTAQEKSIQKKIKLSNVPVLGKLDSLQNSFLQQSKPLTNTNTQKAIDSLKSILQFAQINGIDLSSYIKDIDAIKLDAQFTDQGRFLIDKHIKDFTQWSNQMADVPSLNAVKKTLYYYKEKTNNICNFYKNPEKTEQMALAYLKGLNGFNEGITQAMAEQKSSSAVLSMHDVKVQDLEKMGFQTKKQVQKNLNATMGSASMDKLSKNIKDGQEQLQKVTQLKNEFRNNINELKTKGFKINPMRCLPFGQRWEKSFLWQMNRAHHTQPAQINLSAQVGYKQTERLTYNYLLGGGLGLGQDWRHIHFTFEGLHTGLNVDWKWILGLSAQGGYEMRIKKYQKQYQEILLGNLEPQLLSEIKYLAHTAYAGLMKTYKINSKYKGTMLIAYDFLWNNQNKQSPLIIKFGWKK